MSSREDDGRRRAVLNRRTFMTSAALGAAATGCRRAGMATGPGGGEQSGAEPSSVALADAGGANEATGTTASVGDVDITAETLAEAEKVALVDYTPEERAQILEVIEGQLEAVRVRRAVSLPNEVPPAVVFDPRLPGIEPPGRLSARAAKARSRSLPASEEEIAFSSVVQLGAWLRAGELSSARLTEIYLERLERYDPILECVATLTAERALEQAARADRELRAGRDRGPLHGIPYGAKDLFDTAGVRTGWGAEPYRDRVPERDAVVIRMLEDAGAVLVAKLSLGALAYGDIWYGGRTRNPWNPAEGSNGSSAGSAAAVAAGLVGFSLGTETMGSLTSPALRCGCVGLRPTFGMVPRTGAMALCWSLDKIGPMTRTVEDSALVLQAIIGHDPGDPGARGGGFVFDGDGGVVDQRRVGYVPAWIEASAEPELDRELLAALRDVGVRLVEIDWPELPYSSLMPILLSEAAAAFEELSLSGRDAELSWQAPEAWPNTFRAARFLSAIDVIQAERLRRQVMEAMRDTMDGLDAVIAPAGVIDPVIAGNFTGQPSVALRTALIQSATRGDFRVASIAEGESHRVPYGTSLIGPTYGEGAILEIGAALEARLGIWGERPDLDAAIRNP